MPGKAVLKDIYLIFFLPAREWNNYATAPKRK
jgi:hypothetical protein